MKPKLEMEMVRQLNGIAHRLLALANSSDTLDTKAMADEAEVAAQGIIHVTAAIIDSWPSIRGPDTNQQVQALREMHEKMKEKDEER